MLQLVLGTEEVLRDYLVIISKYQILKFAYTESELVPGHSYADCLLCSVI